MQYQTDPTLIAVQSIDQHDWFVVSSKSHSIFQGAHMLFKKTPGRKQVRRLSQHQQLEPRHLLAGLSTFECAASVTEDVAPLQTSSELGNSEIASALNFSSRRFRPRIQAPTR